MIGDYFSLNGKLLPVSEARIPIDSTEFVYGYGVYETLKVRNGVLYFPELHFGRLLHSARVIGIKVELSERDILKTLCAFVRSVSEESFNVKMLLMGKENGSDLYVFALRPFYVPQKDYREGVKVVTYEGERQFVEAKTLNMLMSYLAYKKAKEDEAYDALLIDKDGHIREGTRTNLFFTDGKKLFTTPLTDVLNGVTRITLLEALRKKGIIVEEIRLHVDDLEKYKGFFLTSTSSKVLPISQIDGKKIEIPPLAREVMRIYDEYLEGYVKGQKVVAKI